MSLFMNIYILLTLSIVTVFCEKPFFFERQPEDAVLNEGEQGVLYCMVSPSDIPDLIYKWYKQESFDGASTVNSLDSLIPINGETGPTFNFNPAYRTQKGYYHCMVESGMYKLVSNMAYIDVNYFEQPTPPQLQTISFSTNVNSAFLPCATPNSSPVMGVEWTKDGVVVLDERLFVLPGDSGANTRGTLMIINVKNSDEGRYVCQTQEAVNGQKIKLSEYDVDTTDGTNQIYTIPQIVYSSEENVNVIEGTSVTMVCASTGFPTPLFKWYLSSNGKDTQISGSDSISIEDHERRLVASNVETEINYKCKAFNTDEKGDAQSRERLFYIMLLDDEDLEIDILKGPVLYTVLKPNFYEPFILECSVRSTGSIRIQWLKNLEPLKDSRIIPENSNSVIDGYDATNRNLQFIIPNESDLGLYQCVLFNSKKMKIQASYVTLEKDSLEYKIGDQTMEQSLDDMEPEYFMLDGLFKVDIGEEACRLKDAHLVSILSQEENDKILSLVPENIQSIWIGLTSEKPDVEGAWLWTQTVDNSAIYSNWIHGKPDNSEEEYAIMITSPDSNVAGRWEDVDNSGKHHVMCKKYTAVCDSIDKSFDGRLRTAGWEEVNAKYVIGQQVGVFCRVPGKEKLSFNEVTCGPERKFIPGEVSKNECSVITSAAHYFHPIIILSVLTLSMLLL